MACVPYHDPNLDQGGNNGNALMSFDEKVAASFSGKGGWGCTNWQYDAVSGKYVRYWFVYYSSTLLDASGNNFSNYSYQAERAAKHLQIDLWNHYFKWLTRNDEKELNNWWNSFNRGDGTTVNRQLGRGTINGRSGHVLEAYGNRDGKYLSGILTLYYNGLVIGKWNFVSGDHTKNNAINAGEWTYTGETGPTDNPGMTVDNFGWYSRLENQFGRRGICIHPDGGSIGYTEGCIGIVGQARDLYNWLSCIHYSMPVFVTW